MISKICSRCQSSFECRFDDIQNCQCNTVSPSTPTRQFLSKTHFDCLCKNCLAELDTQIEEVSHDILPLLNQLREGVDFYKEGRLVVFTERYLILRGYCCQSGCRHCPYGFEK